MERLRSARHKAVGTKQTLKAVDRGTARTVFLARDADERVVRDLIRACEERAVEIVYVESMALLGKACGIQVGAASAAIVDG